MTDELPPGGTELGDGVWQPWHPVEVGELLAGVSASWCVAAGWALDLFRGSQSRDHDDLEICVPAGEFAVIRSALAGFEFDVVGAGRRWPLSSPAFGMLHQTWVRERGTGIYKLDVFREPHVGKVWICRRDPDIRLPYADIIRHTPDGLPYLTPEIVLLFKAKWVRAKDEQDFASVLPLLSDRQRGWLATVLSRVHPGHAWLGRL